MEFVVRPVPVLREIRCQASIGVTAAKNLEMNRAAWQKKYDTVLLLNDLMARGFKVLDEIKALYERLQKAGKELKEKKDLPVEVTERFKAANKYYFCLRRQGNRCISSWLKAVGS